MSKLKQSFAVLREARIDQILNEPITGLLSKGSIKRILVVSSVVSSWVYFINFLIPKQTYNLPVLAIQNYVSWISGFFMAVSFLLMRKAVRRITSLPDKYLDELQIENRDWAFSMGYLIVRRVGLWLSVILVGVFAFVSVWNQAYYSQHPFNAPYDPAIQRWVSEFDYYVKSFVDYGALGALASLLALLTYVAYSFPIILLTWREAKYGEEVKITELEVPGWHTALKRISKGYFFRFWFILGSVAVQVVLVFLSNITRSMSFTNAFIMVFLYTVAYALYVYIWGLEKQWYSVKMLSTTSVPEGARNQKPTVYLMFVICSIVGATVGLSMVSVFFFGWLFYPLAGGFIYYAMVAGLVLLVLHIASFSMIGTIGRIASEEAKK